MCIVIFDEKKEIDTPRQFLEHFGFEAPKETYYNSVNMDSCLCQVDWEKSLTEKNIHFKKEFGVVYILNKIEVKK